MKSKKGHRKPQINKKTNESRSLQKDFSEIKREIQGAQIVLKSRNILFFKFSITGTLENVFVIFFVLFEEIVEGLHTTIFVGNHDEYNSNLITFTKVVIIGKAKTEKINKLL